jgi:hypothetical protein
MKNTMNRTTNFGRRVAAAGVMSAALIAVPSATAVAAPAVHSGSHQAVTTGVLSLKGGTASVKIDSAAVAAMSALGITVSASAGDGSAAVPVTDTWNASIAQGAIAYTAKTVNGATTYRIRAGALSLGKASLTASKGSKSMTFGSVGAQFVSGLGGNVSVKADGKHRIDVLRIANPAVDAKARTATGSLVITPRAAKELNKIFSTTSFKAGQKFGTVTVTAPPAV